MKLLAVYSQRYKCSDRIIYGRLRKLLPDTENDKDWF